MSATAIVITLIGAGALIMILPLLGVLRLEHCARMARGEEEWS